MKKETPSKDINASDLNLEDIPSELEDLESDEATYKINTYGADYTLEILSQKLQEGEIVIPKFQRLYVWSEKKASKLVESFLLGLPVPQIFLYRVPETQDLLVVDGQQRLRSISYFMKGKFESNKVFVLRGVKKEWEGKAFVDLNQPDQRRIRNAILRATIFEQTDPKDDSSVYEIFERLNTGGVALTPQEIRNCVIRGSINPFLESLNEDKNWRELLGHKRPDSRMKDIEMILRFLALYEGWKRYKKPMKDFITDFMKRHKDMSKDAQAKYADIFSQTVEKLNTEIGKDSLRIKAGINIALMDALMVSIATAGPENITNLRKSISKLKQDLSFVSVISEATTNNDKVQSRIKIAQREITQ